jgi:histidine ammonia-lyase
LAVGAGLRRRLEGSTLVGRDRSPDSFSVRATPVVHGAAWDVWGQSRRTLEDELGAVMDNPLWFPEEGTLEGGNFHGAPTALALDALKTALATVAGIAERRVFRVTYGQLSGLPSFLVPDSGLHSGLMLAQYTAASLVSEAKGLSHPAAVDTVPTVQHQEDHVSMAAGAAASARQVLDLVADVAAIELMCGAQGLDLREARGEGRPGAGSARIRDQVRGVVAYWEVDRPLHPDLAALGALVRRGAFLEEAR